MKEPTLLNIYASSMYKMNQQLKEAENLLKEILEYNEFIPYTLVLSLKEYFKE